MNYEDMALTDAELVEWQDSEFPPCDICDGRRGIDCKGHCLGCHDEPHEGGDLCKSCLTKLEIADAKAAKRRGVAS